MVSAELAREAVEGSDADRTRLVLTAAQLASTDDRALDEVLDALAMQAITDGAARELLIRVVHQLGLARPAIAAVITDVDQVDDVAQNTLMAVERGMSAFEGRARFRTWLYRVARNEALMHLRALRRHDQPAAAAFDETAGPATRMSSRAAQRMTLNEAIDALPAHYRDVIVMRANEGASYEDIAQRLGIELNTVRSRLHKARTLLSDRLGEGR